MGRKPLFDITFRRKVIEDLLKGEQTINEISQKYNVSNRSVRHWLTVWQHEQKDLVISPPMAHEQEPVDNSDKDKRELEKELALAKAKIVTLETIIDIAEEQFKIEIRKKSGTKPS